MHYPPLYLKKNEDRRLRAGHLWVYSNEIDTQRSPLKSFAAGDLITVCGSSGKILGIGYINPNVLLCARLLTDTDNTPIDTQFFIQKIQRALQLRQQFYNSACYRLIYGDSDGLPGLVVDRFYDTLVVQISTWGMENLRHLIIEALEAVIKPTHILLRAEGGFRELENLPQYQEVVVGQPPELIALEENGVQFVAPIIAGQKTGWFYDHSANRESLRKIVKDKEVLDVFSYVGGWGVQAAAFGAKHVTCIDSSAKATELVQHNAKLNKVEDKVTTITADAFDAMQQLIQAGKKFDIIILDPPAFIKKRKDSEAGKQAYYRINELAMQLLPETGILLSASCSMHLAYEDLIDIVRACARRQQLHAAIVYQGHQAPDHPVHPAINETAYLKCVTSFLSR